MNLVMVPPPFAVGNGRIMGNGISAEIYNHNPDVIVHTSGQGSVMGYGRVNSITSTDTFHYDPMADYKSWYGLEASSVFTMMNDDEIMARVWDRSEFNQWLAQNVKDLVLVQRHWPSWVLVFKSEADYHSFITWWTYTEKQEKMFLPIPAEYQGKNYVFIRELKEWCDANLVDKFELASQSSRVKCTIRDPQEAVMFRLRWSEPNNNQL